MSISSEISRISGNVAAAYTAASGKGAALPTTQNSANLASTIDSIQSGTVNYAAIGSVLWHAGATPPDGHLVCDGTIYNVADYAELAAFFEANYGSKNYWGGDGETTFAVPDWQGEFFRAAGTQSRADQGSGAAVGAHQDATEHVTLYAGIVNNNPRFQTKPLNSGEWEARKNPDARIRDPNVVGLNFSTTTTFSDPNAEYEYTSRTTNTSLLVCIKAKMVDNMDAVVAAVVEKMQTKLEPVGKVIYHAGKTAPENYLACDGAVYNIADYPKLAQFFADNYDAVNYWGGDGETTFAVPDWQGEFFRAAGANSRSGQGSGAAVGVHQDATRTPYVYYSGNYKRISVTGLDGSTNDPTSMDYENKRTARLYYAGMTDNGNDIVRTLWYSSRPTNTSLLVCIKAT